MELVQVRYIVNYLEQTSTKLDGVDPNMITKLQTGQPLNLTGMPKRPQATGEDIPSDPLWLKHDKQVLRFYGYF